MFRFKAPGRHFMPGSLAKAWGEFTRYVEVGDDQFAIRQIDIFRNGTYLRYDRSHWCDDFGMLLGLRFSRKRKWAKHFPGAVSVVGKEFERLWRAAASSPAAKVQADTARMADWGTAPHWLSTARAV